MAQKLFRFQVRRTPGGPDRALQPEAVRIPARPPQPERHNASAEGPGDGDPPHLRLVQPREQGGNPVEVARWLMPVIEQMLVDGVELGRKLRKKHPPKT